MKIRYGLISNSSASSFIIHYRDSLFNKKNKKLLTKKEVTLLKANGFKLCVLTHPTHLDNTDYKNKSIWIKNEKSVDKNDPLSFAKWITCNQDNEIYLLVKHNIPFIATVHYGHETYIFPCDSKYIYIFHNRGNEVETYHQRDTSEKLNHLIDIWNKDSAGQKISVSEFIKREEKWHKEFKESLSKV